MTTSLPSSPISSIDLPDVKNISGQFIYNFYTKDEKINNTGDLPENLKEILKSSTETVDSSILNLLTQRIPRFIKITFEKINNSSLTNNNDNRTFKNENKTANIGNFIKSNFEKIIFEENFLKENFISIDFQDNNIDNKLFTFVSSSIETKIASNNEMVLSNIEQEKNTLFDKLMKTNSLLDKAKTLHLFDTNLQRNELILSSLLNLEKLGGMYTTEEEQNKQVFDLFEEIQNLTIGVQINKKIFGTITKNIASDPMSIYSDEFTTLTLPASSIEQQAINKRSSRFISESEYKITVEAGKIIVSKNQIPQNISYIVPSIEVVGYLIEKTEIQDDANFIFHEPIILESNATTLAFDAKIKYGSSYLYSARSVSLVKFVFCNPSTNALEIIELLMASRKSPSVLIKTEETVPPPPPADFNINWNYKFDAPMLTWNFPLNTQRDIVKFQVFKRKTINEPFELIREFDFDESLVKTPNLETPNSGLVINSKHPITYFIDEEFKRKHNSYSFLKSDICIYAVRSVDAHGFGSGYSTQFEVSFDNFKNKIIKKQISQSDAPMQYPNIFLKNRDAFIDAIKISNKSKMKVYFEPDFYKVLMKTNDQIDVVKTTKLGGKYKIGLINLDFQQQQGIDIEIEDKRRN